MAYGIGQGLLSYAINFVANHGMKLPRLAFHNHAKVRRMLNRQILRNPGQGLLKKVRVHAGAAQAGNGVPVFVDHLPHQGQYPADGGLAGDSSYKLSSAR
jgi:hypothetical protein